MDDILKDSRFSHIAKDPRFKRLPKKDRKVNIDKRFQSMFTDKKFKVKYTIDKRGRPTDHTSSEDLKRYYNLPSSSDSDSEGSHDDDDDDEVEEVQKRNLSEKKREKLSEKYKSIEQSGESSKLSDPDIESDRSSENSNSEIDSEDKSALTDKVKNRLRDLTVDYARGEGTLLSDSSSDDSSDETDSGDDELDHGWGELDRDAEKTDEITNRLAVCNMDWDRIRAADLMVLFNSFLPQGGIINSVTIYPSEFGLQRMKEEEVKGPLELCEKKDSDEDNDDVIDGTEEAEEGSKYHMEKLRQYQLNRLKYYYAVVVCDAPATANKLYTECDGLEYESSATRLDLRFVPDDTTFDQEPHEVCDRLPELSKYQPRHFTTTALQQAKVELTWDETDPSRAEMTQKLMSGKLEGIDDADLQAYLALSSDEEEVEDKEEKDAMEEASDEDETSSQTGMGDPISKYRALLQDIEQQEEKKKSRDVEMEVTWGVGLKDKTEKMVQKKLKDSMPSLTPFQQYLEKRREKRKQKKEERKKQQCGAEEDDAFSDDDIPSDIDMNDPYFKEEFQDAEKKKKGKKNKKKHKEESEDEESKQKQAELELLLMNEVEDKNHFNLKAIQEQETESKSKRRKKKKRKLEEKGIKQDADEFEVNVQDERFSAIFSSHLFNIDPADPHYRKTKGMEALRAEKLKRRQLEDKNPAKIQRVENSKKKDTELSMLVKTIKRRNAGLKK